MSEETIIVKGRPYHLRVDPPNCDSRRHYHPEEHADGTPGEPAHHHHSPRCAEIPRQATLIPAWEVTASRHVHDFAGGSCACGGTREELPDVRKRRPGGKVPVRRLAAYHNPPDPEHPHGWSYTRKESEK